MPWIQAFEFQSINCSFEYVIQSRFSVVIGGYTYIANSKTYIKSVIKSIFNKA